MGRGREQQRGARREEVVRKELWRERERRRKGEEKEGSDVRRDEEGGEGKGRLEEENERWKERGCKT